MFRVRVATTVNGTLATAFDNGSTVDGVTIATGDVLLLKNQTAGTENGVYTAVASGAPTRVADFETADTVHGYVVSVVEGTTNGNSVWLCTNDTGDDIVGTDNLVFARLGSGGPGLLRVSVHTSSATHTYGAGATRAIVELQGPGGGGGGVDGQGSATCGAAGGGGGGGYAKKLITDLSGIATATITIGTGGAGGSAGANNGANGSAASSYADGTTTLTCNVGTGGTAMTAHGGSTSAAGGTGGTASGGDISLTGMPGAESLAQLGICEKWGDGGHSVLGFGGRAAFGAAGNDARGYGSGGGGAEVEGATTNFAGGNGANGVCIVWEYGHESTAFDASINTLTEVDPALDDYDATADTSDSGNNKKTAKNRTLALGAHVVEGRLTLATGHSVYSPQPATPNATDTAAETVSFAAVHGWVTGTMVTVSATGGGLTAGTIYWLNATDSDTVSFHTTLALAESAGTKVNLTASITATIVPVGVQSTTLRFALHNGNRVRVYDGTRWIVKTFSELSLALTLTSGSNYDVFLDDDAATLSVVVWTSDTVRATALTTQDGVYVKSGDTTKLYLGTIRAANTNTACHRFAGGVGYANPAQFFVWNAYNRVACDAFVYENTSTWTYNTQSFRSLDNSTNNAVGMVRGLDVEPAKLLCHMGAQSTIISGGYGLGIGLDSTTAAAQQKHMNALISEPVAPASGGVLAAFADYFGRPGLGYHYLQLLELGNSSGTTTFYGSGASGLRVGSAVGEVWY
jgi:hypothetical protein